MGKMPTVGKAEVATTLFKELGDSMCNIWLNLGFFKFVKCLHAAHKY